ncbi:S41 family peptidase [Cytophagaceae bacterium DM2B3-1]|uniref:S41 family peptidase n=1 Tax=Xanthocytophaga flava TaxID=3048013 RepID=A0ABT7CVF8_9BACT|nr:S41 family peptidase [Xanthocytophaga flavus]
MYKFSQYLIIVFLAIISCRNESNEPQLTNNQNESFNDSLFALIKETYFWESSLPPKTSFFTSDVITPADIVLKARTYSPKNPATDKNIDKWSTIISLADWSNSVEGKFDDFGCIFRFYSKDDLRIALVQPNSVAGQAGLRRGSKVYSINGIPANDTYGVQLETEIGSQRTIRLSLDYNGKDSLVTLNRTLYDFNPIISSNLFRTVNHTIGYLHIQSFMSSTVRVFKEKITGFQKQNIDALIIDLRYNGGGLISAMEELANVLAPASAQFKVMYSIKHNENYKEFNANTLFAGSDIKLNVKKIYFITTRNTASASEMLIHSLSPYMNIKKVGKPTYGKLMGMYTIPLHRYTLIPVSFMVFNSLGQHDNFMGLNPDIYQSDDLLNEFNEKEECIKAIIADIEISENGKGATTLSHKKNTLSDDYHLLGTSTVFNGAYKTRKSK